MYSDRGILAAAGVVFAFALLWSVAILIPDDRGRSVVRVRPNSRKLKVTNNKYSLVTNNIASSTSTRKLSVTNQQQNISSFKSAQATSSASDNSATTNKRKAPLFPRWAWFGVFIVYHARRYINKKRRFATSTLRYDEEEFFQKSGLDEQLEYGLNPYGLEYEVESVYGSTTVSSTNWSGSETDKFDVNSVSSEDLLNTSQDLDDLLEL